jgi:hypothetical protein
MYLFIEISGGSRTRAHIRQLGRSAAQQLLDIRFYLLPDLRIFQRRDQLRLAHMRKTVAQRTFHQIVIYHCRPRKRKSMGGMIPGIRPHPLQTQSAMRAVM